MYMRPGDVADFNMEYSNHVAIVQEVHGLVTPFNYTFDEAKFSLQLLNNGQPVTHTWVAWPYQKIGSKFFDTHFGIITNSTGYVDVFTKPGTQCASGNPSGGFRVKFADPQVNDPPYYHSDFLKHKR